VEDINEQLADEHDRFKHGYKGATASAADELEALLDDTQDNE